VNTDPGPCQAVFGEVTVHASHKVLMEVDENSMLFDGKSIEFRPEAQASPNTLIKYYFNY
jgi:hypothetical protein